MGAQEGEVALARETEDSMIMLEDASLLDEKDKRWLEGKKETNLRREYEGPQQRTRHGCCPTSDSSFFRLPSSLL